MAICATNRRLKPSFRVYGKIEANKFRYLKGRKLIMIRNIKVLILTLLTSFVWAAESDLYNFSWLDKDKEVYVLQNRKYRKKGKFHVAGNYGRTVSGAFVDSSSIQGRAGYFFTEEFGFEAIYAMNSGDENSTAESVISAGARPFRRIVESYTGGMLLWSPFYSKINTFNSIIYLDFIFGLGLAQLEETNNRLEFETGDPAQPDNTEAHTGIMWNIQAKFYLTQMWNVKLDLNAIHYSAKKAIKDSTEDTYYSNYDLTVGVGLDF